MGIRYLLYTHLLLVFIFCVVSNESRSETSSDGDHHSVKQRYSDDSESYSDESVSSGSIDLNIKEHRHSKYNNNYSKTRNRSHKDSDSRSSSSYEHHQHRHHHHSYSDKDSSSSASHKKSHYVHRDKSSDKSSSSSHDKEIRYVYVHDDKKGHHRSSRYGSSSSDSSSDKGYDAYQYKEYGFPHGDKHMYAYSGHKKYGHEHEKDDYDKDDKYKDAYKHRRCMHTASCMVYMSIITDGTARLFQTTLGNNPELASQYDQDDATDAAVFSNKARGSKCPSLDIGMAIRTSSGTTVDTYLSRFEADPTMSLSTNRMYVHNTGWASIDPFPLVTKIMMKIKGQIVDAYFLEFSHGFAQYNINALTNQRVGQSFQQSICFDLAFYRNQCSRFICQGQSNSVKTTYLRDPDDSINYVASKESNPDAIGMGTWYTAVRLCKDTYVASVGINEDDMLIITRSKTFTKYPYFADTRIIYTDTNTLGSITSTNGFIYTPAHSDVIYACYGPYVYRLDNAYTDTVLPLTPRKTLFDAVEQEGAADCRQIISFEDCVNDVYLIDDDGSLFYSSNGGVDFNLITITFDFEVTNYQVTSLTGFTRPVGNI